MIEDYENDQNIIHSSSIIVNPDNDMVYSSTLWKFIKSIDVSEKIFKLLDINEDNYREVMDTIQSYLD